MQVQPLSTKVRNVIGLAAAATMLAGALSTAGATVIPRDPVQGAGFVAVEGFELLGVPVGDPLEVDIVFTNQQFIQIGSGASIEVGYGVDNRFNTHDLEFRLVFDLTGMGGGLITSDLIVQQDTVEAGIWNVYIGSLTPLPDDLAIHGFRISVDTSFAGGQVPGMFDGYGLFVAGAGPEPGPIIVNRAVLIPEPTSVAILGVAALLLFRRRTVEDRGDPQPHS